MELNRESIVNLEDKHILVVGASSGIGKETALKLSRIGARVTLVARSEEKLKKVMAMMEGHNHQYYAFNITDKLSLESFLKKIVIEQTSLDGFVYTVGSGPNRPLRVSKPEYMENIMNLNFFCFFECCRILTRKGNYNSGMHIVGVSSCASIMGGKGQSAYSASKAAMDASVRVLAQELADKKININTVRPGMIDTETYRNVMETVSEKESRELNEKQFYGLGKPNDIANVIAFLLSPASDFITGANISADGGFTCH